MHLKQSQEGREGGKEREGEGERDRDKHRETETETNKMWRHKDTKKAAAHVQVGHFL